MQCTGKAGGIGLCKLHPRRHLRDTRVGVVHLHRQQQAVFHIFTPFFPRYLRDDLAGGHHTTVAITEVLTERIDGFQQSHLVHDLFPRQLAIPKGEVSLESLRPDPVAQDIPDRHQRRAGSVVQLKVRKIFGDFVVQRQLLIEFKLGQCSGGEQLGITGNHKQGILIYRCIGRRILHAITFHQNDLAVLDNHNGQARHLPVLHAFLDIIIQAVTDKSWGLGKNSRGGQKKKCKQ